MELWTKEGLCSWQKSVHNWERSFCSSSELLFVKGVCVPGSRNNVGMLPSISFSKHTMEFMNVHFTRWVFCFVFPVMWNRSHLSPVFPVLVNSWHGYFLFQALRTGSTQSGQHASWLLCPWEREEKGVVGQIKVPLLSRVHMNQAVHLFWSLWFCWHLDGASCSLGGCIL